MTADPYSVENFSTAIQNILRSYSDDAAQALVPIPDRIIQIQPGQAAAWDVNCDGQLWTRLISMTPNPSASPNRVRGAGTCAVPFWVATMELGIIRCAATMDNKGNAPKAPRITEDGVQGVDDMAVLLGVLQCSDFTRSITSWTPRGPEGGYHGGYWEFTVDMTNCITCEED